MLLTLRNGQQINFPEPLGEPPRDYARDYWGIEYETHESVERYKRWKMFKQEHERIRYLLIAMEHPTGGQK